MEYVLFLDQTHLNLLQKVNHPANRHVLVVLEKLRLQRDGLYCAELTRYEYLKLLIETRRIDISKVLCNRMLDLGLLQNIDFRRDLEMFEMEVNRYCL